MGGTNGCNALEIWDTIRAAPGIATAMVARLTNLPPKNLLLLMTVTCLSISNLSIVRREKTIPYFAAATPEVWPSVHVLLPLERKMVGKLKFEECVRKGYQHMILHTMVQLKVAIQTSK